MLLMLSKRKKIYAFVYALIRKLHRITPVGCAGGEVKHGDASTAAAKPRLFRSDRDRPQLGTWPSKESPAAHHPNTRQLRKW
jgi:hypothetical protein